MVRPARHRYGQNTSFKQPLEASSWQELSANNPVQVRSQNDSNATTFPVYAPKRKHKVDNSAEDSSGLAFELEKSNESALEGTHKPYRNHEVDETNEMDDFMRKNIRSENRRVKRINDRNSHKTCYNCRQTGHEVADCPEVRTDVDHGSGICFKCGSTEHRLERCRVRTPNGELPYAKCFICGESGHLSKQCPDNPRGLYPYGGCCRICGSVEHYKKDCPDQKQKAKAPEDICLARQSNRISADVEVVVRTASASAAAAPAVKRPKIVKF